MDCYRSHSKKNIRDIKINVVPKKQSSMFWRPLEVEAGVELAEKDKRTRRQLCIGKGYKSKLWRNEGTEEQDLEREH